MGRKSVICGKVQVITFLRADKYYRVKATVPRFDYLVKRCNDILGEGSLDFDLAWYLKKKERSYKEKSIGHTLRKKKVWVLSLNVLNDITIIEPSII